MHHHFILIVRLGADGNCWGYAGGPKPFTIFTILQPRFPSRVAYNGGPNRGKDCSEAYIKDRFAEVQCDKIRKKNLPLYIYI